MSGAPSSSRRFKRLFRLITRRYRSFKSLVAKRPPSSWTMGRMSGGHTGTASRIIHSGRLPEMRKASTTSRRLRMRTRFWPEAVSSSSFSSSLVFSTSISSSSFLMASAPMPASKSSSYFSFKSRYSFSVRVCILESSRTLPGLVTMYMEKYSTRSSTRGDKSKIRPIREGMPLKYQMWDTGAASSMWPMRSRRTLLRVTSTPQRSQILPL